MIVLRGGGVALVLDAEAAEATEASEATEAAAATGGAAAGGLPRVLHWGADPGELDEPPTVTGLSLLPLPVDGWAGRPALGGHGPAHPAFPRLRPTAPPTVAGSTLTVRSADEGLAVTSEVTLDEHGVIRIRHTLRNTGDAPYHLAGMLAGLPVPDTATELLDFTGRWCRERQPQRAPLRYGSNARETHRGRTGFDAAGLLLAGTPGFGFRHGEVWAAHLGWSGNAITLAERLPEAGTFLAAGELLEPGEVVLAPGAAYSTPVTYFAYAPDGLDGISARLHGHLRARPRHPRTPRPVTFNTWEAVYFDTDTALLRRLAETAAAIGVERFVLDDGWFRRRRDDTAGLGDWQVDPAIWPAGLHPLVDRVRELGMQFGLWVEPEMVNPDSDLARAHPDWLLAAPGRLPEPRRHQHVLDVAHECAYAYLLDRLDALVTEYDIDFLKWDHNRELVEPVHDGRPGAHVQTLAAYRLLDELRERHPALEIESCASGGGRVDLGVLARTDRVWASDCTDPVERQAIQRWTTLLVPPELVAAHVSAPAAHTTRRTTDLAFRAATALFGHAGIEWDLTSCTPADLDALRGWIAAYRRLRRLLHTGTVVRADLPDETRLLHGVVAPDRSRAVFGYAALATGPDEGSARLRLPGLDPTRRYAVAPLPELAAPATGRGPGIPAPAELTGAALATIGLPAPALLPQQALVLELAPAR